MRHAFLGAPGFLLLAACSHGGPPPNAPLARASDNVRADDAVLVQFVSHHDSERWSVRRGDGSFLCEVPCAYWVKPHSGLSLKLESKPGALQISEDEIKYDVPDALPAAPGDTIVMEVDRTHAGGSAARIVAAPLNDNASVSTDAQSSSSGMGAAAATLGLGVGTLAVSVACAYWWSRTRQGGLDAVTRPSAVPKSVGLRVEPTPFGLRGTF